MLIHRLVIKIYFFCALIPDYFVLNRNIAVQWPDESSYIYLPMSHPNFTKL